MVTAMRAALAFGLLAGFYVLVAAVLGVAAVFDVVAVQHLSSGALKIAIVLTLAALALLRGLILVNRRRPHTEPGVAVGREQEPALWRTVEELAEVVRTRPPDEIRLVAEVNAAVSEDTSWLGLRAGRRRMYIGMPLLMALSADEMRAVLGHELGHYSGAHTRLGGTVYRGRIAVLAAVQSLGNHAWIQKIFFAYAKLFLRVSQTVSRKQELEADEFAVTIAGRDAAGNALRKVHGTDDVWNMFIERYVGMTGMAGSRPANLFGGFHALVNAHVTEIAQADGAGEETSPYDSHPSLRERLGAIAVLPDRPRALDSRPALVLLRDPAVAANALEQTFWTDEALRLRPLPWDEMVATGMYVARNEEPVHDLSVAGQRVVGAREPFLDAALEALARNQSAALYDELVRLNWQQSPTLVANVLARAIEGVLISHGKARWTLSWTGPAKLLDPVGNEVDIKEYAARVVADPAMVAGLRGWLAQMGIPVDFRPPMPVSN
ncbi:M48 family metallopeptidase [Planotetraspora phitsanulokensis]|uniref:Zn-dependent protease n=1 Tax=Planotetraspora phitsanulokensis TaxID=575192 RepID=A0A8J3U9Y1_9ACTN|nr:M48 family metallopeptidase [Planotetraspora phitsanulokensis]GII39777.1 Zn-dependent protease [Planotetraspora phitsanulokensis]